MSQIDIRWKQRFDNFNNAFHQLHLAVELSKTRQLTDLERQGLIQSFEFTHELAWKVLKDYLEYQGVFGIIGSKDASQEAFQKGLITKGDVWMTMIKSRNLTSHTYNKSVSTEIEEKILNEYYECFLQFQKKFEQLS